MIYTLSQNENYKDFLCRTLEGQVSSEQLQLFVFLLELIVSEECVTTYSVILIFDAGEVTIEFTHQGRAIKKNIIDIIDDQVDYLHYQHKTKADYILKFRKRIIK